MALRRSAEDYLEAILVLKNQKGVVRSIDVAHHLDYSKPSVSRAVSNLKRDGYLEMKADGELVFTTQGKKTAEKIYERHTILTALFTSIGVSEETAAEDACRVEHAISDETFDRLKATHKDRISGLAAMADKGDKKKKKKKKKTDKE
ncbi:metal-dependent transcriptional regulator [Clostridia bacterium OttesenSCG-928-O13]|nr:metal-dependent transcriptional regulator [Clostridia bacterium OttesenSCG-928-O13]